MARPFSKSYKKNWIVKPWGHNDLNNGGVAEDNAELHVNIKIHLHADFKHQHDYQITNKANSVSITKTTLNKGLQQK